MNQGIDEIYNQFERINKLVEKNVLLSHSTFKTNNLISLFLTKDGSE